MAERATSFPKSRMKALLLEGVHPKAQALLEQHGFPVESLKTSLSEDDLKEKIRNIYILGIRSKTELSAPVLAEANKLLTVGAFCIGTKQIDHNAANEKGVAIFNDEFSNTRSVAELALSCAAVLLRRVPEKSAQMHRGTWDKSAEGAREIRGKVMGIIGYGKIGGQLSVLAEQLGMDVIFYNTSETTRWGNAQKADSMEEVLKNADIVSVHVDDRASNKGLVGEKEFAQMKQGAIYMDFSRGFVTDAEALARFLKEGHLSGAALDVHSKEPEGNNVEFTSPLKDIDNTIILPHVGGSTQEAQENIGLFVAGKIASFINAGDTTLSVNFPQLQLLPKDNSHRFLHLHRNVAGVMAEIGDILRNINIVGQALDTRGELGYVISDVEREYDQEVIDKLKNVPGTIRFRLLY